MSKTLLLASLLSMPIAAGATGIYQCEPVSEEAWLSEDQLRTVMEERGWKVDRVKKDGGCWEVYGSNPEGVRVEAYLSPEDGEILLVAQRGKILFQKKPSL